MVEFKGKPEVSVKMAEEKAVMAVESEKMAEEKAVMAVEVRAVAEEKPGDVAGIILELIKANPEITLTALASAVGISKRSIERNIQKLQKENILKRVGATKRGRWEVLE
jgi:ATP-dependent DNA helicase RecG